MERTINGSVKKDDLLKNLKIRFSMEKIKENTDESQDFRLLGKAICEENEGLRLDFYLAKNFLFFSRNQWIQALKKGSVLINNGVKKASYRLKEKDQISYFSPQEKEPEVNRHIYPIWEKMGVLAIFKPSSLPMHEGGRYRLNTFCQVLKEDIDKNCAPVHRLDRETSGVVLCASCPDLRRLLSEGFHKHEIEKTYFAIVKGKVEKDSWSVEQKIGTDELSTLRTKQWVSEKGSYAFTEFKVLERKEKFTLLLVKPKTGRTHQIRVHAAWSGYPLVGDKKYQGDDNIFIEYMEKGFTKKVENICLFDRLCLHAGKISFIHPVDKKRHTVASDLPEDMKAIWKSLGEDS